jgi:hypothetical protein
LLEAAGRLLLQLLTTAGELLLQLGDPGLLLLLGAGRLATGLEQQLFPLLARLFPQFCPLALSLLADAGTINKLFPFPAGLGDDFLGLLPGLGQKSLLLADQFHRPFHLPGQGLTNGIQYFNGVLLVYQATP